MPSSLVKHLKKVPEITGLFWAIKILTTAMGEITSDYLVTRYDPVITVGVATLIFIIVLAIQFFSKSFAPWRYWLTVSMVAVVGTMAADVLHVVIGVPYIASTIGFGIILALVFFIWYKSEKTLSIHSVYTKRRELFYWAAIMATFALGTATGDLVATTFQLGYLLSGVLFTALILVTALVYWRTKRHEILWFWTAYILTRPLGASYADWLGKPATAGGLDLGEGLVSIVLIVIIIVLVAYSSLNRREKIRENA